jgi:hypothetical protein
MDKKEGKKTNAKVDIRFKYLRILSCVDYWP